jgi:hypothetical protein
MSDRARQDRPRAAERSWEADRPRYESRVRTMRADDVRNGGHTFREHVDVGPSDTARRARTGERARGGSDRPPPRHATRWTNERAAARSAERLWRSPQARAQLAVQMDRLRNGAPVPAMRISVRMPLNEALGGDWRKHVAGHTAGSGGLRESHFTERSVAVATWRMNADGKWYLRTCYPEVTPRPAP